MAIKTKRPPMKETVGAQYLCFNTMDTDGRWTSTFAEEVEKTEVVKSVKSHGKWRNQLIHTRQEQCMTVILQQLQQISRWKLLHFRLIHLQNYVVTMLILMVLFFQVETDHDHIFAYGKVVKLRKGGYRYDWYPKCKLSGEL